MTVREKLWHLFEKYDRERDALLEYEAAKDGPHFEPLSPQDERRAEFSRMEKAWREKLDLFDRWDRKRDALVEYEKREGVTVPIDHGDESRPE